MSMNTAQRIAFQGACRRALDQLKAGPDSSDVAAARHEISNALNAHTDGDGYTGSADVADACLLAALERLRNVRSPAEAVPQGQPLKPSTATMPSNVQAAIGLIGEARAVLAPHRSPYAI